MTTLVQLIEQMRLRMNELAIDEEGLVRTLADALSRDVKSLTLEHEARRGVILRELQALACRLGAFPRQPENVGAVDGAPRELRPHQHPQLGQQRPIGGTWRQDLVIEEELNFHLRGRTAGK
jgi:hypothetical protein